MTKSFLTGIVGTTANFTTSLQLNGVNVITTANTFGSGAAGIVPASGGGTTNFLRADGTWAAPPSGSGASTSVANTWTAQQTFALSGSGTLVTPIIIQNSATDVTGNKMSINFFSGTVQVGQLGSNRSGVMWTDSTQGFEIDASGVPLASFTPTGHTLYQDIIMSGAGVFLAPGGVAAGSAPLYFASLSSLMTNPQAHAMEWNGSDLYITSSGSVRSRIQTTANDYYNITFIIDGGGSTITTGLKGGMPVDVAGVITQWTVLGTDGNTGSIQIDIWKDTYANFPPTVADTITASAKPLISSSTKNQSSTLTGWNTTINAGDVLYFNVDSVATFTRAVIALKVRKS